MYNYIIVDKFNLCIIKIIRFYCIEFVDMNYLCYFFFNIFIMKI